MRAFATVVKILLDLLYLSWWPNYLPHPTRYPDRWKQIKNMARERAARGETHAIQDDAMPRDRPSIDPPPKV